MRQLKLLDAQPERVTGVVITCDDSDNIKESIESIKRGSRDHVGKQFNLEWFKAAFKGHDKRTLNLLAEAEYVKQIGPDTYEVI
jgi:hypothetical protein